MQPREAFALSEQNEDLCSFMPRLYFLPKLKYEYNVSKMQFLSSLDLG